MQNQGPPQPPPRARAGAGAGPPPRAGAGPPPRAGAGPPPPMRPHTPPQPRKVFLNFRGDDLPIGFMESLMLQLGKEKISIFIERDELRGREPHHPFTRIERSNLALAIFSKRYAESEWCLDELVKMKERVDQNNLPVIPVYYGVSEDDVRRRAGEFGNHFRETRQRYENDQERIRRWEGSLTSIAREGGIVFDGNTSDLVDSIIREVKVKLNIPTYWPSQYVFLTLLLVLFAVNHLQPPHLKISGEWVFGFPVFAAMVWQIANHG